MSCWKYERKVSALTKSAYWQGLQLPAFINGCLSSSVIYLWEYRSFIQCICWDELCLFLPGGAFNIIMAGFMTSYEEDSNFVNQCDLYVYRLFPAHSYIYMFREIAPVTFTVTCHIGHSVVCVNCRHSVACVLCAFCVHRKHIIHKSWLESDMKIMLCLWVRIRLMKSIFICFIPSVLLQTAPRVCWLCYRIWIRNKPNIVSLNIFWGWNKLWSLC